MKATAIAHANIAFVKYWGNRNDEAGKEGLNLPYNDSISMNLDNAITKTTVEFSPDYKEDVVIINGKVVEGRKKERVVNFLNFVRELASVEHKCKVASENNFPMGCGIASSASAGAALALACCKALGLPTEESFVSRMARRFSGSASRSVPPGFVRWKASENDEECFATSIASPHHWKLCDVVAMVSEEHKKVTSAQGHLLAKTSPFFKARLEEVKERVEKVHQAILDKDIATLGEEIEREAISMHVVMMTSSPPLFYWSPETIALIKALHEWRESGEVQAYFTIDAGPNVHLICEEREKDKLLELLQGLPFLKRTFINFPSEGAKLVKEHLF